ncbi:MAG: hexosyltransferase, partial [Acidimicrobiia bacterium]
HVADLAAARPPGAVAVRPGHDRALGAAIIAALRDAERRGALAEVARRFAVDHDRHHTVDAFEGLYRRLSASS